jgi:hypothetical protein
MPKQEGVRSYQLRKKKSSKPRGFIDISICISDDGKKPNSHTGTQLFHSQPKIFCLSASLLLLFCI